MKGVDTNVVVRYITRDDAARERAALRFLDAAKARGVPVLVNVIVLCETAWVLQRVYGHPKADVAAVVEALLTTEQILVEDADVAWLALADFRAGRGDFADCLIGRRNQKLGCDATVTFDGRLKVLGSFSLLPSTRG